MEKSIHVDRSSNPTRLVLRGTVNLFVVTELQGVAVDLLAAGSSVVVDCTEVAHLDGSGCQVLLALRAGLLRLGAELTLTAVPERLGRFLRLAGMTDLVPSATT